MDRWKNKYCFSLNIFSYRLQYTKKNISLETSKIYFSHDTGTQKFIKVLTGSFG